MSTTSSSNSIVRYYSATAIAVIGWGLSTTFVQFGLNFVNAYLFLAVRFLLALLIVTPLVLLTRRKEVFALLRSRWPYIIAFCETSGLLFQYQGQEMQVSAGLSSLLTMMFILIVPLLSTVLLREKFHPNHAIAIILGLIGVLCIITEGDISRLASSSILGIILLLLSALSYAFYQLSTSKYTREINPNTDSIALFYVAMLMITAYSWFMAFINNSVTFIPVDGWYWVILLAFFSTILAFIGYFEASKGIPANTLAILLMLQMLVPFFVDIIFLHINYSVWIYGGGIIIVLGMYFVATIPITLPQGINQTPIEANKSDSVILADVQPELVK